MWAKFAVNGSQLGNFGLPSLLQLGALPCSSKVSQNFGSLRMNLVDNRVKASF